MGWFDDIVPPDTASGGGYRPLSTGLFDDIVPPDRQPRARSLATPVRLAQAPSVAFGAEPPGQDDEVVVPAQQPRKVSFGTDDEIVENATNPPRRNGTPERRVPLAPEASSAPPTPRARAAHDLMGGMTIDPLTGASIPSPPTPPNPPVASTPEANGMFPAQPLDDIPLSRRHGYLGGGAFGDAGTLTYEEAQAEKAGRIAAAEADSRRATAFRERQERRIAYPWETPSEDQRQIDALVAQGMPLEYAEQAVRRSSGDRVKAAVGAEKSAEEAAAAARTAPLAARNYARNLTEEFARSVADVSVATTAGAVRAGAYLGGTQNRAHRLADWIGSGRESLRQAFPGEVSRQGDLALEVAGGLGSAVPFMATGAAAALLGLPAGAATALVAATGAFSQGEMSRAEAAEFLKKRDAELRQFYRLDDPELKGDARRTAQEAFDRARNVTADDLKLLAVYLVNGAMGTTEALPIANALERVNRLSGGAISRVAKAMGYNSLEEAVQEGAQQFVQNATEQLVYNKDKLVGDGVERAAIVAGLTGALQGGMIHAGGELRGTSTGTGIEARIPRPPEPAPIDFSDIRPAPRSGGEGAEPEAAKPETASRGQSGEAKNVAVSGDAARGDAAQERSVDQVDAMLKTSGLAAERLARYRDQGLLDRAAGIMRQGLDEHSAWERAVMADVLENATSEQVDAAYGAGAHDEILAAAAPQDGVDRQEPGAEGRVAHDGEAGAPKVGLEAGRAGTEDELTGAAPPSGQEREGQDLGTGRAPPRDDHEQIVRKWRQVRKPLPLNATAQRKDIIRGYRRELSKLGLLDAKTEGDVRSRLMDREGESPEAAKPDIIERTGAAPPGVPPPSATRTADLIKPRPQGGVFDSGGSATMPGEVRSPGGTRGTPTRVRDKAGGADPASSNDMHGAPSGAVFDSSEPSGRRVENEPASATAAGEGGAGPGVFVKVSESMSAAAAAYQARVTGSKAGTAYRVNGVKFDGFGNGVLIDAKGRYAQFIKDGKFRRWFRGKLGFIKQAERQRAAANSTPIEWRFAEEAAANATRTWFEELKISGIDIVHVP